MLTRIEIDGFKAFRQFSLDVPPFLVLIGRNAAGKSNLFDAIQFLRLIADRPLLEAAQETRGDFTELFHRHVDGTRMTRMRFAVEVLVNPTVTDAFGVTQEIEHTQLRYEVVIERRRVRRYERPYVVLEQIESIRKSAGAGNLLLTYMDADAPEGYLITEGVSSAFPANDVTATFLSSITGVGQHLSSYALRQELRSWGLLQLDPVALRAPSGYADPDVLAPNGAYLANTLRRIIDETASDDRPEGVLADLVADVTAVIPEVVGIQLDEDEARQQRQLVVITRDEAPFPARVASDGTLRAIALLTALYDPQAAGMVCFEEPENGIYPQRLARFVTHLRDLIGRKIEARRDDAQAPLAQLLLSSHSPTILEALRPRDEQHGALRDDAVFLDTWSHIEPGEPKSRVTRVRRIAATRELPPGAPVGTVVSPAEIDEFEVIDRLDI